MILFRSIQYQNFLSCGDSPIKVILNKNNNTLLIGKNGSGKSTAVTDAIVFALFGKAFRAINKPEIVNSENNKNCLVEVEFEINGKEYKVRRGIKPNVFEIYRDNELIEKDSDVDSYQTYLESHILRMNFKTFVQIVILGSAGYIPFMQLKSADRKEITETLLDCEIYSVMHVLGKQKLQAIKGALDKNETEQRLLNNSLSVIESNIKQMQDANKTDIKALEKTIEKNLKTIESNKKKINSALDLSDKIQKIKAEMSDRRNKNNEFASVKTKMEVNIEILKKENDFFETKDNCPTCTQPIDALFKSNKLSTNVDAIEKRKTNIQVATKSIETLEKELKKFEDELDKLNQKINEIQILKNENSSLEKLNKSIEQQIKDANNANTILSDNIKAKEDAKARLFELEAQRKNDLEEKEYYEQINSVLKDGGIKTKIIKRYIPKFNKIVNKYLSAMNLYVNFTIDENFNEKILSRYKSNFSYSNFSEGEKFRIDLAILFAWREIAQERNSVSTNLLVMDEIFDSSLDSEGTDDFIKIMFNDLTKGTNLFVISHKSDQLVDKFEQVIRFEKVKGFSKMVK